MPTTNPQSGNSLSSASGESSSSADAGNGVVANTFRMAKHRLLRGNASSRSGASNTGKRRHHLPGVIVLLERSEWARVAERARKHPREVEQWATLRKSISGSGYRDGGSLFNSGSTLSETSPFVPEEGEIGGGTPRSTQGEKSISNVKCKALHHATHRLRSVHSYRMMSTRRHAQPLNCDSFSTINSAESTYGTHSAYRGRSSDHEAHEAEDDDEWVEACKCILTLIEIHPEACGQRESRHGCLPIHLAAFSMCPTPPPPLQEKSFGRVDVMVSPTESRSVDVACPSWQSLSDAAGEILDDKPPPPPPQSSPPPCGQHSSSGAVHPLHEPRYSMGSPEGGATRKTRKSAPAEQALPPPLRMQKSRSLSNSSAELSLGGISAMINQEIFAGGQSSRKMEDIEAAMVAREEELRRRKLREEESKSPPPQAVLLGSSPQSPGDEDCGSAEEVGVEIMGPAHVSRHRLHPAPHDSQGNGHRAHRPKPLPPASPLTSFGGKQSPLDEARQQYLRIDKVRREEYSVKVINSLLDAYPRGIKVDSEGGRLPLHMACAGRATPKVIATLLKAYPDAARHRTKDGYLPLHLVAHWGVSDAEVAPMLLRAYPDATVGRNRWERTPLEEALGMAGENGREHQAALVRALRKHPTYWSRPSMELGGLLAPKAGKGAPTMAGRTNGGGATSGGHNVVDVDETVVDDLSSSQEDEFGGGMSPGTPLLAEEGGFFSHDEQHKRNGVMSRLTPRSVLRKKAEGGSGEGGGSGSKQRHQLSKNGPGAAAAALAEASDMFTLIKASNWPAVVARAETHPSEAAGVQVMTVRGGYNATVSPLHFACERNPPVEIVEALIEAFSQATQRRKEPGGQLPLHAACTWGASPSVVAYLLAASPSAARKADDLANLPLHGACFAGADAEAIESLVCTYPRAVWARNGQGSSATDIVKRLRHPNRKEILALLERHTTELLLRNRAPGDQTQELIADSSAKGQELDTDAGGKGHNEDFDGYPNSHPKSSKERSKKKTAAKSLEVEVAIGDGEGDEDTADGMLWI